MWMNQRARFAGLAVPIMATVVWLGCNSNNGGTSGAQAAQPANDAKIAVTTKSEEARKEFLQGRDLSERLLAQDSLQHFEKAVALDPDFASAELALANAAPTAKEFFEHLNKAVALADKCSDGEKLLILSTQDGANGNVAKQKAEMEKLVAAYPNDERARFNVGAFYFGQQQFKEAAEQLKKATEIAPSYSPSYNMLGYSLRQTGDYAGAEQAFKKYIELIPNDPNPYDSYAELLLKMGRFEDSLTQYHKALDLDANFNPSRFGISADLTYMGKAGEAQTELQTMAQKARNDGELRTAYFAMAVAASDGGQYAKALQAMDKEYAVAEKKNDVAAMAQDLQAMGNILMEVPSYDKAAEKFEKSRQLIEGSSLSQEIKDNAKLVSHANLASVAIAKKDAKTAQVEIDEFRKGADASNNPNLVRLGHELAGRLALSQKNYDGAIAELQQASMQNPRNLFRLAQAFEGKGDAAQAKDYYGQAANFNPLPQLNYAFIRGKAKKMAAAKS